jgi:hypothetical protein
MTLLAKTVTITAHDTAVVEQHESIVSEHAHTVTPGGAPFLLLAFFPTVTLLSFLVFLAVAARRGQR